MINKKHSGKILDKHLKDSLEDNGMKVPVKEGLKVALAGGQVGGKIEKKKEVGETKQRAQERRRAKILTKLEHFISEIPEDKIKHGDIAKYMRLMADLEGMITVQKEEKHLHIHKENIDSLDEVALRKRLREIEDSRTTQPIDVVEAIIVDSEV